MVLHRRKDKKLSKEQEEKVIVINAPCHGNLTFPDLVDLRINGRFTGSLEFCGILTAGESSDIEANITGDNVVLAGKVRGDITAHKMLVLMPTATLKGNIFTPRLNIVEGAVFQGNCQMIEELLDIEEVSRYLEIDIKEIELLANSGQIPGRKTGNNWRFERTKIDHWASSGKV